MAVGGLVSCDVGKKELERLAPYLCSAFYKRLVHEVRRRDKGY